MIDTIAAATMGRLTAAAIIAASRSVGWAGRADVDAPLIEAVMVGQIGAAGISFTSQGREVTSEPS